MPDQKTPRVVIDTDPEGNVTVYADPGVTVYGVCEHIPQDRVYRFTPAAIPAGKLDGPVGHLGDGSAAETRAHRAAALIDGKPHLSVVQEDPA